MLVIAHPAYGVYGEPLRRVGLQHDCHLLVCGLDVHEEMRFLAAELKHVDLPEVVPLLPVRVVEVGGSRKLPPQPRKREVRVHELEHRAVMEVRGLRVRYQRTTWGEKGCQFT